MAIDANILLQGGTVPDIMTALQRGAQAGDMMSQMMEARRNRPVMRERAKLENELLQAQANRAEMLANNPNMLMSADARAFENLISGFTPEKQQEARLVRAGLKSRAATAQHVVIGGVPHIWDPATQTYRKASVEGETVTAETVGESKGTIAAGEERGRGEGKLVANTIDKAFETIPKIQGNVRNIDRALSALDAGAKTGAIQRFLPSITSASKQLDQIQNELGLDIVGATTFGALSEGELKLALETALPTGLDEPALKQWLMDKKVGQEKLIAYFQDQIDFLDQGGTVPQFVRRQKRLADSRQEAPLAPTQAVPTQAPVTGVEFDQSLLEFMTPEERALFNGSN